MIVVGGLSLLTKPIWLEFVNYGLMTYSAHHKELDLNIIGEWDWLVGLILILGAITWNTINRLIDLNTQERNDPAYKTVKSRTYESFEKMANDVYFLLLDNEHIKKSVGPNSGSSTIEELRTDLTMWYKYRKESIIPNNQKIKEILQQNEAYLSQRQMTIARKMLLHIDAFEEHVRNPDFDYSKFRFPVEFRDLIETTCFESAKSSSNLKREIKWLKKQFGKLGVKDWYLIGSSVLTPEVSRDVDVVILVNYNGDLKRQIELIKFNFKLELRKHLHLTVFNEEEDNLFSEFIAKNEFRLRE